MSSRARLLIVDDNPDNVSMLTLVLRSANYSHIEGVMSAQAALDSVRRATPDLILLDLHMSGIDGFEFLEQLRQTLCADDFLPVLVVTADPNGRAMGARANRRSRWARPIFWPNRSSFSTSRSAFATCSKRAFCIWN